MSAWIIPKGVPLAITVIIGDAPPVIIKARPTAPTARCPQCGHRSARVHSHYWRSVQDLPWQSVPLRWLLDCRRFWCPNPACSRRIFCERWPTPWVGVHQQRTQAVWAHLRAWGWTASAADVARVATQEGVSVSADTVIRALRAAPETPAPPVRVLGLDEWAKRKGHTYATVLVDQERHRIADVLPDDQPETVAAWLHAHPTIEWVTRDRDEAFAKAIAMGAPDATQVADRFHLLQNLRDVLERVFHRHRPEPGDTPSLHPPGGTDGPAAPTTPLSRAERRAQVQTLTALGYSQTAIAERLGIDRRTVRQDAAAAPMGAPTQPLGGASDPPDAPLSPAQHRRQAQWQAIQDRVAAG